MPLENLRRPKVGYSESRRRILTLSPLILLAGCDFTAGSNTEPLLRRVQKFNDWVQEKVFDPGKLAPEYGDADLTPESGFRVNDYDTDEPDIDLEHWSLVIESPGISPVTIMLEEIRALPRVVKNLRHCCVEGWSMIPQWGGPVLRDVLRLAKADLSARYVLVQCGDDYYTSYDMPSVLHEQTMLATEAYGKPLSLEHGAPARIVMPTKLGYKSAKWVNKIVVTNEKPGGYWEDQGYDWFAGL